MSVKKTNLANKRFFSFFRLKLRKEMEVRGVG